MKVRWEDIPPEGRELSLDELPFVCLQGSYGEAEQEAEVVSVPKGKLFFQRTPKGIEVTGSIRTTLSLRCARCLKECILPVELEFEECFIHMKDAPRDEDTELCRMTWTSVFCPREESISRIS